MNYTELRSASAKILGTSPQSETGDFGAIQSDELKVPGRIDFDFAKPMPILLTKSVNFEI